MKLSSWTLVSWWLTDSEWVAGPGLFADGDTVPGDGGVRLGQQALARAPWVAEDSGAACLLVGLHPTETLALSPGGGVAKHQEVHPDVGRPPVPLETEKVEMRDMMRSTSETWIISIMISHISDEDQVALVSVLVSWVTWWHFSPQSQRLDDIRWPRENNRWKWRQSMEWMMTAQRNNTRENINWMVLTRASVSGVGWQTFSGINTPIIMCCIEGGTWHRDNQDAGWRR